MLKKLLEHNAGYFAIISNMETRPWGVLFANSENPLHYDSNHAELSKATSRELPQVVGEIEKFYKAMNIVPRIYVNQFSSPPDIRAFLAMAGYNLFVDPYRVMLWDNISETPPMRPGITVEKVGVHNRAEALRILVGETPWGTPEIITKVFEREFDHPEVQYYLVRKDGTPAATGFLFYQGDMARVENFRTLPEFRKQGCATALIHHMQQEFALRGGRGLYLLASDVVAESLYRKCGFKDMGLVEHVATYKSLSPIAER